MVIKISKIYFKFHPKYYILPEDKEIILKQLNNNNKTEDNLWSYKQ